MATLYEEHEYKGRPNPIQRAFVPPCGCKVIYKLVWPEDPIEDFSDADDPFECLQDLIWFDGITYCPTHSPDPAQAVK